MNRRNLFKMGAGLVVAAILPRRAFADNESPKIEVAGDDGWYKVTHVEGDRVFQMRYRFNPGQSFLEVGVRNIDGGLTRMDVDWARVMEPKT